MACVLFVDDEPVLTWAAAMFLRNRGHVVHTASNGQEAIALAADVKPDVLVIDVNLEGSLGGYEVADTLAAALPALKTVVITGLDADDSSQHRSPHVVAVLHKPFSLEKLATAVEGQPAP